jgi:Tfp pilus assembly protein PilN
LTLIIVTLVVLVSLAVLVYPFVVGQSESERAEDSADDLAQRLRRSRDRVYEEIRALQQEYFLDNMTEEQYRGQLGAARLEAARLMQQQRQVQQTLQDIEATVEAEMRNATGESRTQDAGDGTDEHTS